METLEQLMRVLPPELQREVEDFARFLVEKRTSRPGRKLQQDWAEALKEYRDQYTALELQNRALDWRGD